MPDERAAFPVRRASAAARRSRGRRAAAQENARREQGSSFVAASPSRPSLAANREEPEQIRKRENEAARRCVDAKAEVERQIDRNAPKAAVPARWIAEVAVARDSVHARGAEEVDAVDRTMSAVDR